MQDTRLADREVVLLGIGHTNAHILKMWRMKRPRNTRLTCVSNFPCVTYSGMLPGVLAGQYAEEQMEIDLVRLCAANGARLIIGDVVGLEAEADSNALQFADRPPMPFDVLSIGIGSLIRPAGAQGVASDVGDESPQRILIKPMQTFLDRLRGHIAQIPQESEQQGSEQPERTLAIVGAGAGGVEVTLCISHFLRQERPDIHWKVALVSGAEEVIPDYSVATRQRVMKALEQQQIEVRTGCRVLSVSDGYFQLQDRAPLPVDLPVDIGVWASGATSAPLLSQLGLPVDANGFITVDENLQSTSGRPVFAVGDAASLPFDYVMKAGVFAVREGPILWENIQRSLAQKPLVPYRPQRDFLRLLNTGDGKAIAQYKGLSVTSNWAWKLKDWIDRKFMKMYQRYKPMQMTSNADADEDVDMRCLGCGGKVGGSILQRVLEQVRPYERAETIKGIESGGDDAAVLAPIAGREIAATTDFFVAPWDDPYLVGKICALHAASDCFAMGSEPFAALANVTLPLGKPRRQEDCLLQLLSGANDVFREMRVSLVGGHTIEGPHLAIGFTVLSQHEDAALLKSQIEPEDVLVITKPIGIGVLLAAQMQARCKGIWWEECLATMLGSNGPAAQIAKELGATAMTDVTGFGVAGHLGEMLEGAGLSAEVNLNQMPIIPGAAELTSQKLESTLAPANRDWERIIKVSESLRESPEYGLLFDPQTSGGLLIAIAEPQCAQLLTRLAEIGIDGHAIGRILPRKEYVELRVV
jgi:selenide,water dikinase